MRTSKVQVLLALMGAILVGSDGEFVVDTLAVSACC